MKIQLIAIGNELLNGKTTDKNGHWLAAECFRRHFNLQKVHIIGDDPKLFQSAMTSALEEADAVITSGGLGPTKDDLTKQMMADYFHFKCVYNAKAEKIILEHFKRGNKEYDYSKYDYHNSPVEFEVFHNPTGYAPGLGYVTPDNKVVCATPGVPNEYKAMLTESVFDFLVSNLPQSTRLRENVVVKTWKLPEADIFGKLCPTLWEDLANFGEVSSLPHMVGVDIGVYLEGSSPEEIQKKKDEVLKVIFQSPLKDFIWHIGQKSLEQVILQEAQINGLSIGFAESATGGLCSDRISNIPGASQILKGSIVCYQEDIKTNLLKVDPETIAQYSVYSDQVAKQMAQGALLALNCDIAVAITGVAGPNDDGPHPAGKVSIAVADKNSCESETFYFKGDREGLKFRFSQIALFKLLEKVKAKPL